MVGLRKSLPPTDDLLAVAREFIHPAAGKKSDVRRNAVTLSSLVITPASPDRRPRHDLTADETPPPTQTNPRPR